MPDKSAPKEELALPGQAQLVDVAMTKGSKHCEEPPLLISELSKNLPTPFLQGPPPGLQPPTGVPSHGSLLHYTGNCRPCGFFWKPGSCQNKENLEFAASGTKFDVLEWRWNVMGLMMVPPRRCIDSARILHWDGPVKPWDQNLSTRLQTLYDELVGPFVPSRPCKWRTNDLMLDTDSE